MTPEPMPFAGGADVMSTTQMPTEQSSTILARQLDAHQRTPAPSAESLRCSGGYIGSWIIPRVRCTP